MEVWDDIWIKFRILVEHLNESLMVEAAGYTVRIDRHANDVFPLRAWASYSRLSAPGEERFVISLDFKRDGGIVVGHIDLAKGDGYVLADQPVTTVALPEVEQSLRAFLATQSTIDRV